MVFVFETLGMKQLKRNPRQLQPRGSVIGSQLRVHVSVPRRETCFQPGPSLEAVLPTRKPEALKPSQGHSMTQRQLSKTRNSGDSGSRPPPLHRLWEESNPP